MVNNPDCVDTINRVLLSQTKEEVFESIGGSEFQKPPVNRKHIFLSFFNQGYGFDEIFGKIIGVLTSAKTRLKELDPILVKTPYLKIPCDFLVISVDKDSYKAFIGGYKKELKKYAEIIWPYELKKSIKKWFRDYQRQGVIMSPIFHKQPPKDSDIEEWHTKFKIHSPYIFHEQFFPSTPRPGTTFLFYRNSLDSRKVLNFKKIKINDVEYKLESWKGYQNRIKNEAQNRKKKLEIAKNRIRQKIYSI